MRAMLGKGFTYDVQASFPHSPTQNEVLPLLLALRSVGVPAKWFGCEATAITPPAATAQVFALCAGSKQIGTLTFEVGKRVGAFAGNADGMALAAGEALSMRLVGAADGVFHGLVVALRLSVLSRSLRLRRARQAP